MTYITKVSVQEGICIIGQIIWPFKDTKFVYYLYDIIYS
jgi:hypothetical protein